MVFPGHTYFLVFDLCYNPNLSTVLCYLLSYNPLLAVNPMKYFTIIIDIADLFKTTYV